MASLYKIVVPITLLLNILIAANIAPNKLIIKFRPYSGKMQSLSIGSAQDLPENIVSINNKYGVTKVKVYGTTNHKSLSGKTLHRNHLANFAVLKFDKSQNIDLLIEKYSVLPEIELVQPVYRYHALVTPNEPGYISLQKDYMDLISAQSAWDTTTGNGSVVIAIIDSGIRITHNDISSNIWINGADPIGGGDSDGNGYLDDYYGWDFVGNDNNIDDDNGHGTMVSGISGAVGNNGTGVAGICWDCKIMGLKVLDEFGGGDGDNLIDAINYATDKGVDIINMSLGQTAPDSLLEAACANAEAAGILLIAAMGNVNAEYGIKKESILYPAAFDSVMGVGAVNDNGLIADFSVVGNYPYTTEITAPGVDITSTYREHNSSYATGDGTSFAAPIVSGVAALIKTVTPTITLADLRSRLQTSANDAGRPGKDAVYGYGILDANKAVINGVGSSILPNEDIEDLFNFPNPVTGEQTTFIFTAKNNVKKVSVTIYDLRGALIKKIEGGSQSPGEYRLIWDLTSTSGKKVVNGSYIYIMKITDSQGNYRYKEIISIAR